MPVPAGPSPEPSVDRPSAGTTTRPSAGVTSRPSSGETERPVAGTAPVDGEGYVT